MYCDPYLEDETAFLLTDEGNVARGYILCAENYEHYTGHMTARVNRLSFPYSLLGKAELKFYERHKEEYPAHLHIDILEEYTGNHHGTMLMKAMLDLLRQHHVKGVCLGVARANQRAVSFYLHNGFKVLAEDEGGFFMGQKLITD
jgi:ribosomal protein S18 acetylase RimI-like enzyme